MNQLGKLRATAGFSQSELGRLLGVSQDLVYNWESGRSCPTLEKILRYAELLGVSVEDLITAITTGKPPRKQADPIAARVRALENEVAEIRQAVLRKEADNHAKK